MNTATRKWMAMIGVLLVGLIVLLRTAWISDDAMITFRCVLNFIHGHGAVFNIGERVQAYTHPLWFMFLTLGTWIMGSVYLCTFVISIVISMIVLFLLLWNSRHVLYAWIWIFILLLSQSFVDFSTSGLENPLSHLMLIIGLIAGCRFLETTKRSYLWIASVVLFTSYLSRPDLVLIMLPFWILLISKVNTWRERVLCFFISNIPNILWTIFSLIYYGFPFPNTAYAKLNNGIPTLELMKQGGVYFWNSVTVGPVTLAIILTALLVSALQTKREIKAIALGIVLYLFYILSIGGDFMAGRFFSVPVVISIFILSISTLPIRLRSVVMIALLILGAYSLPSTLFSGDGYMKPQILQNGITDERGFWFQKNGLITSKPHAFLFPYTDKEKTVWRTCGSLGELGMQKNTIDHIIDLCGLSDPLLARMPPLKVEKWRIGHFYRQIPTNYEYLMKSGEESSLIDPSVRAYWKILKIITRDPVFSISRLSTIMKVNLGWIKKPDFHLYADQPVPSQIQPISRFQDIKSPEHESDITLFNFIYALQIDLGKPISIKTIDLSIQSGNDIRIFYEYEDRFQTLLELAVKPGMLNRFRIRLPSPSPPTTQLLLVPISTAINPIGNPSLGNFSINMQ